jgi:tetratricopeptide (TPR) repeat protein
MRDKRKQSNIIGVNQNAIIRGFCITVGEKFRMSKDKISIDKEKKTSRLTETFTFISANWPIFLFILSILGVLTGWVILDISPLQPLEEIAFKQSEYRLSAKQESMKSEMVSSHIKLGNTFLNIMQLEAAQNEFEEALKLDPYNLSAQKGLSKSELFMPIMQNDYDPEIMEKRLNLILEEDPYDPHAYLFLGILYRDIDHEQALIYYEKAIDKDPSIAAAYFGIGTIYDIQNKPDDAITMYEKALSLSKWNQPFLDNLGYHYCQRKEYQKAIQQYELLLRLNPRFLPAYYTISNAYRLTGNLEQARWDQKILVNLLDNKNVTALQRNKEIWFYSFNSETVFLYNYPEKKYYAYYNLALTCYLLGNETEAIQYVKKAKDLQIDKDLEFNVKKLINYDIDNLQEEESYFLNRTDEFRRKFL